MVPSPVTIEGSLSQEIKDQLPEYEMRFIDSKGFCHSGFYGTDPHYVLDILYKFGYKLVSAGPGPWTLQRTPSSVTSAMKHLVVESPSYTSRAVLWGTVPPELRDVYKKAGCKETKHDAITVMDLLSKHGFRVLSQSQRQDGLMSWTLGKQM